MKECIDCKKILALELFRARKPNKKTGKIYYESVCKECESIRNKIRLKKRYEEKGRLEFKEKYSNLEFREEHLKNQKNGI